VRRTWLACHRCNKFKGNRPTRWIQSHKQQRRLFNPRLQTGASTFSGVVDGTQVIGMTPSGAHSRSAPDNNEYVVLKLDVSGSLAGWHPPARIGVAGFTEPPSSATLFVAIFEIESFCSSDHLVRGQFYYARSMAR